MSKEHQYFVYILASGLGGTLYIGVTNNLVRRTFEHRSGAVEGFSKKYDVKSPARKTPKEMEPGLEDSSDRGSKPKLERSL